MPWQRSMPFVVVVDVEPEHIDETRESGLTEDAETDLVHRLSPLADVLDIRRA